MGGADSTIIQLLPKNVSARKPIARKPIVKVHTANVEEPFTNLHRHDLIAGE